MGLQSIISCVFALITRMFSPCQSCPARNVSRSCSAGGCASIFQPPYVFQYAYKLVSFLAIQYAIPGEHRYVRRVLFHRLFIHCIQGLYRQLDVLNQGITSRSREILPHDHPHQLQLLAMRRHGISRYDPAPLSQLMSNSKFVIVRFLLAIQTKRHEW